MCVLDRLYQLRITVNGIQPPIWRRIQIKDCTLHKLHQHIQTAMGWESCYAYEFAINGICYRDPDAWHPEFEDFGDASTVRLSEFVPDSGKRFRFRYVHDFGFSWDHEILFEGCLRIEKGTGYPLCLEGERASPLDDVGGPHGYRVYLEAMADPNHEHHQEFMVCRGPYAPETFDVEAVTERMRRGYPKWHDEKWT